MEQILHTVIEAGLEKPVKVLHVTDVHLTMTDPADPIEQQEHMDRRREVFRKEANFPPRTPSEYFEEAFRIAAEEGAQTVVTGDVTDVCCEGNLKEFHRIADGKDFLFCPGSHEFASFARGATDDSWKKIFADNRERVEASFPDMKMAFDSRIVGGVNLITLDNDLDVFGREALDGLKAEAAKGLPMILFMHDPLHDHGLLRVREIPAVMRRPVEDYLLSDTVIGFIASCPLILATFAGHWHGAQEAVAPCGKKVFITPGLFKGICRMIEIR